jgi:hypothetical protein
MLVDPDTVLSRAAANHLFQLIVWGLLQVVKTNCGHNHMQLATSHARYIRPSLKFRSITEAIDTGTPTGRALWQMIGVLAELEPHRGAN